MRRLDGINTLYGFGVYNSSPTTWTNADGYLPALVTSFTSAGAKVSITNFGDRVVIGGNPFVLIYSRVAVQNPTGQAVTVDPQPSTGLVPLNKAADQVGPGATVDHDCVVAEDRFGGTYAWHPRQHVQRGLLHRRPRAARRDRQGGRDQHPVLGRDVGLLVAVSPVRREDR